MSLPDINITTIVITLIFICLDVITGLIQAVKNKTFDSTKMRVGLWHKCGFILAITLGIVCEWSIGIIDLGFNVPIQTPVCAFVCLTEIASILENLGEITPELMNNKFMEIFKRSKENNDI